MGSGLPALLDRLVSRGHEPGAAVAVVRDGRVEVNATGGTRDGSTPWTSDTLVMTFSVAKPFAALALLTAVREGSLELDQPVASVWPEFAAHGKGATTMRHLLAHQAGLPSFQPEAAQIDFDDRDALVQLLADAVPVHPPGTGIAEHALTYGHLLDEVLRRATGVPLADRFAGIAKTAGWDLHLRLEKPDLARTARLVEPTGDWATGYLADPRWGPALGRPAGLLDPDVLNSARFRCTAFPAVSLHATALSLARFYDDVVRPDGHVAGLLGRDLWRGYTGPAASGSDLVIGRDVTWTLGFQLEEDAGRVDLGMGGAGGCFAWGEPAAGYGAAFVTRGLGGHDRDDEIWSAVHAEFAP